jgi:sugar/nucleoside kinase (ribokinase family)
MTSCPHGNPIPGQVEAPAFLRCQHAYRLDTAQPSVPVVVVTIAEVVEDEQALITLLHGKDFTPGTELVVVERGADGGCVLPANGGRVYVTGNVAPMVWLWTVEP